MILPYGRRHSIMLPMGSPQESPCPRLVLVCSVALLCLAACLPRNVQTVRVSSDAPRTPTITVAHWNAGESFPALLREYEQASAGRVRVRSLVFPRQRYHLELTTLMLSGQGPDLMALTEDHLPSYRANRWVHPRPDSLRAPLHRPASGTRGEDSFVPFPPFALETYRLIYNAAMFRQSGLAADDPPDTLRELIAHARRIGAAFAPSRSAFGLDVGEGISAFRETAEVGAIRSGIHHFSGEPIRYELSIYEPWFHVMLELDSLEFLLPGWRTLTKKGLIENFLRENVAMIVVNSGDFAFIDAHMPDDLEIRVAPVPALREEPVAAGVVRAAYAFAVSRNAEPQSDAFLVLRYLYSPLVQTQLLERSIGIPLFRAREPVAQAPQSMPFSFDAFLPRQSERFRSDPQSRFDAPVLLEGFRSCLQTDPSRIADILQETADICRERVVGVRGTTRF